MTDPDNDSDNVPESVNDSHESDTHPSSVESDSDHSLIDDENVEIDEIAQGQANVVEEEPFLLEIVDDEPEIPVAKILDENVENAENELAAAYSLAEFIETPEDVPTGDPSSEGEPFVMEVVDEDTAPHAVSGPPPLPPPLSSPKVPAPPRTGPPFANGTVFDNDVVEDRENPTAFRVIRILVAGLAAIIVVGSACTLFRWLITPKDGSEQTRRTPPEATPDIDPPPATIPPALEWPGRPVLPSPDTEYDRFPSLQPSPDTERDRFPPVPPSPDTEHDRCPPVPESTQEFPRTPEPAFTDILDPPELPDLEFSPVIPNPPVEESVEVVPPTPEETEPEESENEKELPPSPNASTYYLEWPFEESEAQRRQEETARLLHIPVELENDMGMTMRLIPAGEYMMGTDEQLAGQGVRCGPSHRARVTEPFYMSAHETTHSAWKEIFGTTRGDRTQGNVPDTGEDFPVCEMTWGDAVMFCNLLSEKEGLEPYYSILVSEKTYNSDRILGLRATSLGGTGYRLPTETEWEFACRAGTEESRYGEVDLIAWYGEDSRILPLNPVGRKDPNAFLLYDMLGNASEWCWARLEEGYNPSLQGTHYLDRVSRGGDVGESEDRCCSAYRCKSSLGNSNKCRGFRVARTARIKLEKENREPPAAEEDEPSQPSQPLPELGGSYNLAELTSLPLASELSPNEVDPVLYSWPTGSSEARRRREETAQMMDIPVEVRNEIGMRFQLIPAGDFTMGNRRNRESHNVQWSTSGPATISQPFYISSFETTWQDWTRTMGDQEPVIRPEGNEGEDLRPASCISWYEAVIFCNVLSEKEGREPYYEITNIVRLEATPAKVKSMDVRRLGGSGYRLPTEAEWEFACRAGGRGDAYGRTSDISWIYWNTEGVKQPVGTLGPNTFWLFDMLGNVAEWSDPLPFESQPIASLHGGSTERGEWIASAPAIRRFDPASSLSPSGFRVAFSPIAVEAEKNDE